MFFFSKFPNNRRNPNENKQFSILFLNHPVLTESRNQIILCMIRFAWNYSALPAFIIYKNPGFQLVSVCFIGFFKRGSKNKLQTMIAALNWNSIKIKLPTEFSNRDRFSFLLFKIYRAQSPFAVCCTKNQQEYLRRYCRTLCSRNRWNPLLSALHL